MRKFQKKPIFVEAEQWFGVERIPGEQRNKFGIMYYIPPDTEGMTVCKKCDNMLIEHGWLGRKVSGYLVCPKDWLVRDARNELYPVSPGIFEKIYEEVLDDQTK